MLFEWNVRFLTPKCSLAWTTSWSGWMNNLPHIVQGNFFVPSATKLCKHEGNCLWFLACFLALIGSSGFLALSSKLLKISKAAFPSNSNGFSSFTGSTLIISMILEFLALFLFTFSVSSTFSSVTATFFHKSKQSRPKNSWKHQSQEFRKQK